AVSTTRHPSAAGATPSAAWSLPQHCGKQQARLLPIWPSPLHPSKLVPLQAAGQGRHADPSMRKQELLQQADLTLRPILMALSSGILAGPVVHLLHRNKDLYLITRIIVCDNQGLLHQVRPTRARIEAIGPSGISVVTGAVQLHARPVLPVCLAHVGSRQIRIS